MLFKTKLFKMEKYVILCLLTSATLYNYSTCWLDSKASGRRAATTSPIAIITILCMIFLFI